MSSRSSRPLGQGTSWSEVALSWLSAWLIWSIPAGLYLLVRFFGTTEEMEWSKSPGAVLWLTLVVGAVFGTADCVTGWMVAKSRLRMSPYWVILLVKTASLILAVIVSIFMARVYSALTGAIEWNQLLPVFWERITEKRVVSAIVFMGSVAAVVALLRQMTVMVGGRVLFNLMLGRYRRPREEERIFMFLDMKGSTRHAEQLGHFSFCQLIQDVFRDLGDCANEFHVEIYKYVGDQAILTWRVKDGVSQANCLKIFFAFQELLNSKQAAYREKYGLFPEFKAGLNVGKVNSLEIGVLKREIAFLSDVLNTGARIQDQCNELGQNLLVSGGVKSLVGDVDGLEFQSMGQVSFRGKEAPQEIYAVREAA